MQGKFFRLPGWRGGGPDADGQLLLGRIGTRFANGFEFPVVFKMLLDDPPVKQGQRTEMHGLTPAPNFFGRLAGLPKNVIVLVVPVMLAVNGYARGLQVVALEDAINEKLQLTQRLALFSDEPARIRRGDMQKWRTIQQ